MLPRRLPFGLSMQQQAQQQQSRVEMAAVRQTEKRSGARAFSIVIGERLAAITADSVSAYAFGDDTEADI